MGYESLFGPIITTIDVEEAILKTFRTWYPEWLAEVERQKSLQRGFLVRPPDPESYHGGDDFDSWKEDTCPELIAVVKGTGSELHASAGYTGIYEVEVAIVLIQQAEEEARLQVSLHGAALMFLVQQPDLGGLAERLVMTGPPPTPEFPNPENRRIARAKVNFTVYVSTIVEENAGPVQPNPSESPEYKHPEEEWSKEPTVETTDVSFEFKTETEKV